MVDDKHENVQWEASINSSTRYNNIFGCIQTRLGGNMSGNFHMGVMVSYRENVAHKYSRARSSEVSHPFKYSLPGSVINPSSSGQHDSSILLVEHGRNPERTTADQDFKTNLVLSVRETNLSYSRIYSKYRQSFGRLGISQFSGQQRMETCPMSFKIICKQFGTPLVDLFASRLCHQLPRYMSWRPDPQSIATDALHQDWKNQFCYAFLPFSLIGRVLRKVLKDQTKLIVTPAWQRQSWYPTLLKMAIADPFLLPKHQKILLNSEGKIHPLVQNSTLRLVAWLVSGKLICRANIGKGY